MAKQRAICATHLPGLLRDVRQWLADEFPDIR